MEGMEGQFDAVITDPPYGLSSEPDITDVLTQANDSSMPGQMCATTRILDGPVVGT